MSGLRNKTLIVTGASRGIGRALAIALAQAGVNLVLCARSAIPLAECTMECAGFGVKVHHVDGDASQAEVARSMVETASSLSEFYGFIHNAGSAYPGPYLWELPEHEFNEVLGANLTAGYQLIRYAVPELRRRGEGLAVFVGSGAAQANLPGLGAYAVAKAAEEHLARQLAVEAPELISFVYRPGVVETEMQKAAREAQGSAAEQIRPVFQGYQDQGILIQPEDAANALVRILHGSPETFHGKIATWRDGV